MILGTTDWKNKYSDEDGQIYIRPMTYDDAETFVRWRNSDAVKKYFIYREKFTREGQIAWMKNNVDTGRAAQMIVALVSDDRPIGCVYFLNIDRTHNKAEYGVLIGETDARGKGYGTKIAKLMLKFGFEDLGLHRIYLRALEGNDRAIRSYENAGFKKEGLLADDVLIDGEYVNVVWMAAINPASKV